MTVDVFGTTGDRPSALSQRRRSMPARVRRSLFGFVGALAGVLSVSPAFAEGDVENGERVFGRLCGACHAVDEGVNRVGPSLAGIYEDEAAQVEGFRYSDALIDSGLEWDEQTLADYLTSPREVVPGGRMAFAGIRNPDQLADVIAYMRTLEPAE